MIGWLISGALATTSLAGHAQYGIAQFDTLDVRHDRSKPMVVRVEASKSHAVACLYAGRAEELQNTALFMLDLAPEMKADTLLAKTYLTVGYSCKENDPGKALEYMYKALEYAERSGKPNLIGWVEKETGIVFKQMGQFREAITWLERAEAHVISRDEVNRTACHMSEAYDELGMKDSAMFYAQRSNLITAAGMDPYGYARSQLILGRAYAAMGETDMAELFFQKSIAVCDSFDIVRVMPTALVGLARVRLAMGDPNAAITLGRRALAVAEQATNLPSSIEVTALLEQAYHAAGQPDSAYLSLKKHSLLQDSLVNVAALSKVENMRFGQQLKDKEEEAAHAEAKAERSRNIQYGIIALAVITLIIFLLMLSRSSVVGARAIKNLSLVALLLVFEFLNLLLHPLLDRITDHSPLLMLLAMVCIAGLLIPMHHRMETLITNMLVSKNNRVRLEAAKRTIEELEGGGTPTASSNERKAE
ncbi:MAG: tetratricopeptide repeat protein [Flavobacteriales bacterium]|nr:tetratricopeptide repeat protein [Flavobacteriales bacterium]